MSINKVTLTGNLTRDPELRQTNSGSHVLTLGLAVNDRRRNQSTGEWEDYANFVNCVVFGPRAEALAKYLTKGAKVAIEGKLHWSQWEQDGNKRSKIEVYIDELEFFSARNGESGGGGERYQAPTASNAPSSAQIPAVPEITVYDDDIPF